MSEMNETQATETAEKALTTTGPTLPAAFRAVAPWEDSRKRALLTAIKQGDRAGVIRSFYGATPPKEPQLDQMADLIIESRRENVSVIGNNDVFVRRTELGSMKAVVAAVELSLEEGTLYRIPSGHKKDGYKWVPVYDNPNQAYVSAEGLNRLNSVAGCSVIMPPHVVVDGKRVANPHICYNEQRELSRVVVSVAVAGPSPMTGNIVVSQYILDADPRMDFMRMLSNTMKGKKSKHDDEDDGGDALLANAAVQVISREAWVDFCAEMPPAERRRWNWIPLHSGLGFAYSTAFKEVRNHIDKWVGILDHFVRKATTVARRNAMKAHPALAQHRVLVDARGVARIRVVGWAAGQADLDGYAKAIDAVARGERMPGINVITQENVYDPEADHIGEGALDVVGLAPEDGEVVDPDRMARLRAQLDELACDASPAKLASVGYPPGPGVTEDDLVAMLAALT
jgi:hypothetical protein